jgi:outer membrane immunogenic protein
MKRLLLGALLVLLGAASAAAAERAATYSWTGWYVGVNGGWTFGNNSTGSLVGYTPAFRNAVRAGSTPGIFGANHEGGFGGGQIGYNWQIAHWLVGIETDFQGADMGRIASLSYSGAISDPSISTARDHIDWFGTLRGRVGVPAGPVLLYATGGLAYGAVRTDVTNVFTPITGGNVLGSGSSTRIGWAAGAGVEWALASNWTVRGEYLHVDLGQSDVTVFDATIGPSQFATYHFSHMADSVRIAVSYRFNATAVVAKY